MLLTWPPHPVSSRFLTPLYTSHPSNRSVPPAPCYWGDLGPFIQVEPEACLTEDIQSVLGGGMDG